MGRISVKGVLVGGIVDIFSSIVLGIPFALYPVSKVDLSNVPKGRVESTAASAIQGNVPLFVWQLLVGLACSMLGGYVAARIAKHDEILNGCLSALLCVGLSVYTIASGKDANPLWIQVLLLVASPVFAFLGGYLMWRQRHPSSC